MLVSGDDDPTLRGTDLVRVQFGLDSGSRRPEVSRHVDATAHILYETNLHPVPEEHIGQLVYVCVGADRLEVHLGATALVDRLLHHSHVIVIDGPIRYSVT